MPVCDPSVRAQLLTRRLAAAVATIAMLTTGAVVATPAFAEVGAPPATQPLPPEDVLEQPDPGVVEEPMDAADLPTGIDISRWQHPNGASINWNSVRGAGHSFAIIKASEGVDYVNPYYAQDIADARGVGLIVGSYHFARPSKPITSDAVSEARQFVRTMGNTSARGVLPPVLDLEQNGGLTSSELISWTRTWLETVTAETGRTPMIYTYKNFWSSRMAGTSQFTAYPLWLAYYNEELGSLVGNWPDWAIWQYTSSGSVPGISGRIDMNVFNGTQADLAAFANGAAAPSFTPSSPFPPVDVVATPANGSAKLSWKPGYDGGSAVTGYTVTLQPGGLSYNLSAKRRSMTFPGLVNGTRYTMSVTAVNAVGASDPVSVKARPNVPTTLTVTVNDTGISYGESVTISGSLVRADTGAALAGRSVKIEGRTAASGGYAPIATLTTDANGAVTLTRAPKASAEYRVRYAGGADGGPSIGTRKVAVSPVLSATLSAATVVAGKKATLKGRVTPVRSGYVYRQMLIGGRWSTLDKARLSANGNYTFTFKTVTKGVKTYRVYLPTSSSFASSLSNSSAITVR